MRTVEGASADEGVLKLATSEIFVPWGRPSCNSGRAHNLKSGSGAIYFKQGLYSDTNKINVLTKNLPKFPNDFDNGGRGWMNGSVRVWGAPHL